MPEKKRQHYIPKFYLRNFSTDSQKRMIGLFNINTELYIVNAKLKTQAYKDYLYSHDINIENSLEGLDNISSNVVSKIIQLSYVPRPITSAHDALITFVLLLHFRTIYARDVVAESFDKMAKRYYSMVPSLNKEIGDSLPTLKEPILLSIETAFISRDLAYDLDYKLIINNSDIAFISSDNPVTFYNQHLETKNVIGSTSGVAVAGLQILLPISPKHYLIFYDPKIYKIGHRKKSVIYVSKNNDIEALNSLQLINSHENIYFNNSITNYYISQLYNSYKRFRPRKKAKVFDLGKVQTVDGYHESLIALSRVDIKCKLNLSFIRIIKKAGKQIINKGRVPLRDEYLCRRHTEFLRLVDEGKYRPYEFRKFMKNLYNQGIT